MNKIQYKLDLFGYFLSRLIKYYEWPPNHEEGIRSVPGSLSGLRIFKLLWFTCLESSALSDDGFGLFKVYDNFQAYPNGPLEIDTYESRDIIYGLSYSSGQYDTYDITKIEKLELDEDDKDLIDRALKELSRNLGHREMESKKLIEISQISRAWDYGFLYTLGRHMDLGSRDKIWKEYSDYRAKCKRVSK